MALERENLEQEFQPNLFLAVLYGTNDFNFLSLCFLTNIMEIISVQKDYYRK